MGPGVRETFEVDFPRFWVKGSTKKSSLSSLCCSKGLHCWAPAWWMCCLKKGLWIWRKWEKSQIGFENKDVLWSFSYKTDPFLPSLVQQLPVFSGLQQNWIFGIPREKPLLFYISWGFVTHFAVSFLISAYSWLSHLARSSLFYLCLQCTVGSGKFPCQSVLQKITQTNCFSPNFSAQNFLRNINTVKKGTQELHFHTRES